MRSKQIYIALPYCSSCQALIVAVLLVGIYVPVLIFTSERFFLIAAFALAGIILTAEPLFRLLLLVGFLPFVHKGIASGLGGFGIYDIYDAIFIVLFGARILFIDLLQWKKVPVLGWTVIMAAAFVPSLINAQQFLPALKAMVQLIASVLTTVGIFYYLSEKERIRYVPLILKLMALEAAFIGALAVYQSRSESILGLVSGRVYFAGLGDVNYYATYLVVSLALALGIAFSGRRWYQRLLFLVASAIISSAIVATVSRSAILTLLVVTFGYAIYFGMYKWRSGKFAGVLSVAVLVSVFAVLFFTNLGKRVVDLFSLSQRVETVVVGRDVSIAQRQKIAEVSFRAVAKNPLIGVGLGNFESSFDVYKGSFLSTGSARSAHNTAIRILAETGVVGFIPSLIFVFSLILYLLRGIRIAPTASDNALLFGLFAGLASFFLMSLTLDQLYEPQFWVMVGIALAVAKHYREVGQTLIQGKGSK